MFKFCFCDLCFGRRQAVEAVNTHPVSARAFFGSKNGLQTEAHQDPRYVFCHTEAKWAHRGFLSFLRPKIKKGENPSAHGLYNVYHGLWDDLQCSWPQYPLAGFKRRC